MYRCSFMLDTPLRLVTSRWIAKTHFRKGTFSSS